MSKNLHLRSLYEFLSFLALVSLGTSHLIVAVLALESAFVLFEEQV